MLKIALQDFYFQFHTKQHYFLCHDILEDAWKTNPNYNKGDAVVSLILTATGAYHYRRHNYVGAYKSFGKALKVIEKYDSAINIGLDIEAYKALLVELINATKKEKSFEPIHLPLTATMEQVILQQYPHYAMTYYKIEDDYIIYHHLKRDRTEVEAARKRALQARNKWI
ncbi:DUF309 domain-containing protein [Staphylococcus ureilyticus]|uniref:DUF309 domain-containing protein n=1 Tax=Staphylococcus ureilyticus TaxID=94138 RepID=UPI0029011D65|nr:DUF309 domain-containing protein [Staphylococcus ureilyticus]MDU0463480.1 DUF309 domain-containing protein [Staphylococcus ureilyticus]